MLSISRYRKTRFWGLYEAGELLCVTVYRKGAEAVKARIERGPARTSGVLAEPHSDLATDRRVRRA